MTVLGRTPPKPRTATGAVQRFGLRRVAASLARCVQARARHAHDTDETPERDRAGPPAAPHDAARSTRAGGTDGRTNAMGRRRFCGPRSPRFGDKQSTCQAARRLWKVRGKEKCGNGGPVRQWLRKGPKAHARGVASGRRRSAAPNVVRTSAARNSAKFGWKIGRKQPSLDAVFRKTNF